MKNNSKKDFNLQDKFDNIERALNKSSIIAITNPQGVIEYANDNFCEISKYSKEELIGKNHNIINSGYHSRKFFKEMWQTIGTGNIWRGEIRNRAKDDSYYWVDTTIVPFLNEKGKPSNYIAIRNDITQLKKHEKTIENMTFYDPLTKLANRNYVSHWLDFVEEAELQLDAVLFIDIDRFKAINGRYDHATGDYVLKLVASRIRNCTRTSDLLIRQGGDEFIMFLSNAPTIDTVTKMAESIIKQFKKPIKIKNEFITFTTKIGISLNQYESEPECVDLLIKKADTAKEHAKKQTGNLYCFNTDDQNNTVERFNLIEFELRKALNYNEFNVVYQPIVNLANEEIVGVEALLRWENPKIGHVSPVEFIPILEAHGNIDSVGKWVLETVCQQVNEWHEMGYNLKRAAVNVSPTQFTDPYFIEDVKDVLKKTDINPKHLEFEMTEGTLINSKARLKDLENLGIRISIDDFGTGYSSLSYLNKLSIQTLKIDRSFISDLNQDGEVIIKTIISMGKNLNYNIVAEGIENEEQLNFLKKQQCHEGQGYYWSKPVPPHEIEKLFKRFL